MTYDSTKLRGLWSIPHVGVIEPRFDLVRLATTRTKAELDVSLPGDELRRVTHSYQTKNKRRRRGGYRSLVEIVGCPGDKWIDVLMGATEQLASYKLMRVEMALDIKIESHSIDAVLDAVQKQIGVPKTFASSIKVFSKPPQSAKEALRRERRGLIGPRTQYMASAKARFNIVIYIRREKLPGQGELGSVVVRIEFVLLYNAIDRMLGGRTLDHLKKCDWAAFIRKNLIREVVVLRQLGKLLVRMGKGRRGYGAIAVANAYLDKCAKSEAHLFSSLSDAKAAWSSPVKVREHLRQLQGRERRRLSLPGPRRRPIVTDEAIEACFRRRPLRMNVFVVDDQGQCVARY